jgi:hypothetical protein
VVSFSFGHGMEHRTVCMLSTHIELPPQPWDFFSASLDTEQL